MTIPPPESSGESIANNARAVTEVLGILKQEGLITLAAVDLIAQGHNTSTALILAEAEIDTGCTIDYSRGVITCP